jgi:hypothetical protein
LFTGIKKVLCCLGLRGTALSGTLRVTRRSRCLANLFELLVSLVECYMSVCYRVDLRVPIPKTRVCRKISERMFLVTTIHAEHRPMFDIEVASLV